jgi:glucokinase
MLTLGTGVGGAILSDGKLLRGHLGRAGHCGHLCLDPNGSPGITGLPGTLEDAIGNHSVHTRSGGQFTSTRDLVEAVQAGDADAIGCWEKSLLALACGISSLVNIIDPEVVLIGGGIAQVGDLLFTPLQRMLGRVEWRPGTSGVTLRHATLGEWAGAVGALPDIVSLSVKTGELNRR